MTSAEASDDSDATLQLLRMVEESIKDDGDSSDDDLVPKDDITLPPSLRDPLSDEFDANQYKKFAKLRYRAKQAEDKLTDIVKKKKSSEQHSETLFQKLIATQKENESLAITSARLKLQLKQAVAQGFNVELPIEAEEELQVPLPKSCSDPQSDNFDVEAYKNWTKLKYHLSDQKLKLDYSNAQLSAAKQQGQELENELKSFHRRSEELSDENKHYKTQSRRLKKLLSQVSDNLSSTQQKLQAAFGEKSRLKMKVFEIASNLEAMTQSFSVSPQIRHPCAQNTRPKASKVMVQIP